MKDLEEDPTRVCSVCEEQFTEVTEFERHLLQHNLYLCPSCERCFKYKRSYQNHRFLCEDGISKVTKPKSATRNKPYNLSNGSAKKIVNSQESSVVKDIVKKNSKTDDDNTETTSNQEQHEDSTNSEHCQLSNNAAAPQIKTEEPETENTPTPPPIRDEPSPKLSEHQLPAKKRKTVTLDEPETDNTIQAHQPMTNDCDLRTLALAAASVSPHSKLIIESLKKNNESESTNRSGVSSPASNVSYKSIETNTAATSTKDKIHHHHHRHRASQELKVQQQAPQPPEIVREVAETSHHRSTFTPQFMLPSAFVPPNGNPREPAFTWQGIEIQSETNIIARMDGYNPATEQHYVLYKCCICSNAFPNLQLMVSHLGIHGRGPKEHGCEKCGAVFKWRSQLEVHEQVHMVMDNMALSRASSLLSPTPRAIVEIEEAPRDFSCSKNSTAKNNFVSYPSIPTSPFFPVVFPSNNYSPPSTNHPENNNKTQSQPRSNESIPATTSEKLNNHRNQASFQCNYCTKRFDRLFSMQRHERIHTGVKPCFCKQCGRGFSERRNLRHHVIRFHSDATQREGGGRRSKKSSKNRNPSHKLVSFLKKTAVRILNTMEQSKYGIPDPFEQVLMDKSLPEDGQVLHEVTPTTDEQSSQDVPLSLLVPKAKLRQTEEEQDKLDGRKPREDISESETFMEVEVDPDLMMGGGNDKSNDDDKLPREEVTIVIPTEVIGNGRESDSSLPELRNSQREVLRDPKRSLIGSRRKGRPFRYAPSSQCSSQNGSEELDINTNSHGSVHTNPTPPLTIVKEEIDPGLDDNSNFCCQFPFNLSGKENSEDSLQKYGFPGETSSQFKARLRGHGTFFSNYNPRLGVVNSPVIRSEACRPQIGPDGKYVYPCSYCFKTFCSTSDLNRHMDFHEDVRPFKCPYCNYYSRTNSQLKVHTMRHEGIKQFLCSLCNYNGVTQSDLNRHCKTRTHVLRARNCCLTCGVGFYTRTLLEEHLRLVNHCALDYGLIKKERDECLHESDLAEVREISDSDPLTADNSNSNETNNNDYGFHSKQIDDGGPPEQDIPLYLGQNPSNTPVMV